MGQFGSGWGLYACGARTWAGVHPQNGTWLLGKVNCKKWTCPTCGPKKKRQFRKGVFQFARLNKADKFLTLTLDPEKVEAADSLEYIKKIWSKFRIYLDRKVGKLKWVSVVEFQKNGYAHLHIILDKGLSQRWVSETWDKLGGGKIVDIRKVQEDRIGAYLAKYLSKGFAEELFKKGMRRFSSTKGAGIMKGKGDFKSLCMFNYPLEQIIDQHQEKLANLGCGLDGMLAWAEFSTWPAAPPF